MASLVSYCIEASAKGKSRLREISQERSQTRQSKQKRYIQRHIAHFSRSIIFQKWRIRRVWISLTIEHSWSICSVQAWGRILPKHEFPCWIYSHDIWWPREIDILVLLLDIRKKHRCHPVWWSFRILSNLISTAIPISSCLPWTLWRVYSRPVQPLLGWDASRSNVDSQVVYDMLLV